MPRRPLRPVVLLLVLLLAPAAARAQALTVEGVVRDAATRIPVPDAAVTVLDAGTRAVLADGLATDAQGRFAATLTGTAVAPDDALPDGYAVAPASPNPVRAGTAVTVRYQAPAGPAPALEIYDAQGRRVEPSGALAAGVYFYRLCFEGGPASPARSLVVLGGGTLDVRLERSAAPLTAAAAKAGARQDVIVQAARADYETAEVAADAAADGEVALALTPTTLPQPPDTYTYDVTYADDAVVLEDAALDAVVEVDTAARRYVFDADALAQQGTTLAAGQVLLLAGIDLARITAVTPDGGRLLVDAEPATLDELIDTGTMSWEQEIDYDDFRTAQLRLAGKNAPCSSSLAEMQVTFDCTVDDYTIKLQVTPGQTQTGLLVEVQKQVNGNATATFTGTATIGRFQNRASASFDGGEVDNLSVENDGLSADMQIDLVAVGSGSSDLNFKLPAPAVTIPFTVGPIPMSIGIGVQVIASLDVPFDVQAQASATTTFSFDGDSGLTYGGTDVETQVQVNGSDITDGTFDSSSLFTPVDAQFGVAFPRVSLNVLTQEVAWVHSGFTIGSSITFGPICKKGYGRIVAEGGYGLSFFGIPLVQEKETFYDDQKTAGDDC